MIVYLGFLLKGIVFGSAASQLWHRHLKIINLKPTDYISYVSDPGNSRDPHHQAMSPQSWSMIMKTVHLDLNFIRNKDPCQYLAISKNILYPIPWFIYDSNTHVVHGDITRDADIHHYIKFEDIV